MINRRAPLARQCFSLCVLKALQCANFLAAMVLDNLGSHGNTFSLCATWRFQTPRTGQNSTGKPVAPGGHRPWRHGCPGSHVAGSLAGRPSGIGWSSGRRNPARPKPDDAASEPPTGQPRKWRRLLDR